MSDIDLYFGLVLGYDLYKYVSEYLYHWQLYLKEIRKNLEWTK